LKNYQNLQTTQQSLQQGKFKCVDLVQYYIQQIEEKASLNAFLEVYVDDALQQAKIIDKKIAKKEPLGKLFGLVIGIKDVICYKNHPVSAASKILDNFISVYSSTVVERLIKE